MPEALDNLFQLKQQQMGYAPLTQMMLGTPPQLQQETPDLGPATPTTALPGGVAPVDPLDAQIAELDKKVREGWTALNQHKNIDDLLPQNLKDFDKYNEQRYQESYGGKGVLGTAGRALANLLSGYAHGGQTIKQRLTEENRKDWEQARKVAESQIQQQRLDQANALAQQNQYLQGLRMQQTARQQAAQLALGNRNADIKEAAPGAKATVEQDRIKQTKEHLVELGLWDKMTPEQQATVIAGGKSVKQETNPDEKKALTIWRQSKASSSGWEAQNYNAKGQPIGEPIRDGQPGMNIAGSNYANEHLMAVPQADGSTKLVPVTSVSQRTAIGVQPNTTGTPPGVVGGARITGEGTKVGDKPYTPQERQQFANARSGLDALNKLEGFIKENPGQLALAALPGSLGARELNAFRKEAIDVITRLRTGAALNQDEEKFYQSQLPTALDLTEPKAIQAKIDIYKKLFLRLANRENLVNEDKKPLSADEFKKKHGIK